MTDLKKIEDYVSSEKGQETILSQLDKHEKKIAESIISLRDNEYIQKMVGHWQTLSDKDRKSIYEAGSMSLLPSAKRMLFNTGPLPRAISVVFGKKTASHQLFDNFSVLTRVLVHLGVLPKPAGLTDDDLRKNIADDAKGIRLQFTAIEGLCTVVPELWPALPFIKRAKPFVLLGSVAQERILQAVVNTPKHDVVTTRTKDDMADIFSAEPTAQAA